MPVCKRKKINRTKLCTGDLDQPVSIRTRAIQPVSPGNTQPTEVFTEQKQVWAGVETAGEYAQGHAKFDDINTEEIATHIFYIYYDPDLTLERNNTFILFENQYYKILRITDHNERHNMTALYSRLTGLSTRGASAA